jgi:hypothetical protein
LPPGWIGGGPQANLFGWKTMILPMLDQGPLYNQLTPLFNSVMTLTPDANNGPLQTRLNVFRCPSDTGVGVVITPLTLPPYTPDNAVTTTFGRSNYPGVVGAVVDLATVPRPGLPSGRGTFSQNSRRSFRDFTDGLSNCFLVGERRSPAQAAGGFVGGDTIWPGVGDEVSIQGIAFAVGDCAPNNRLNLVHPTAPSQTDNRPYSGFGSWHTGGGHFLMGDGAVRFISENIATGPPDLPGSTYQILATINSGQPVGEF